MIDLSDLRSASGLLGLRSVSGIGRKTTLELAERLDTVLESGRQQIATCEKAGVEPVGFFDGRFPNRLRELPNPPAVLFVRGNVELVATSKLVAVVGTPEPTPFGKSITEELTGALCAAGWGIVGGLEKGIGALAHQTALEAGCSTIAVMGGGLDAIYPSENAALAERIVESGGALVTEQPFGAPARPANLIDRARLVSALATAVLIPQCVLRGGAVHVARSAAAQGRPVFCPVPAEKGAPSEGALNLLETPGKELCDLVPGWRNSRSLCEQLGDQPLAKPVESGTVDALLSSLGAAAQPV